MRSGPSVANQPEEAGGGDSTPFVSPAKTTSLTPRCESMALLTRGEAERVLLPGAEARRGSNTSNGHPWDERAVAGERDAASDVRS